MADRPSRKKVKKEARSTGRKAARKCFMGALHKSAKISDVILAELKDTFGDPNMSDDSGSVTDVESAHQRGSSTPPEGFVAPLRLSFRWRSRFAFAFA
jgi:hypothetical protein